MTCQSSTSASTAARPPPRVFIREWGVGDAEPDTAADAISPGQMPVVAPDEPE